MQLRSIFLIKLASSLIVLDLISMVQSLDYCANEKRFLRVSQIDSEEEEWRVERFFEAHNATVNANITRFYDCYLACRHDFLCLAFVQVEVDCISWYDHDTIETHNETGHLQVNTTDEDFRDRVFIWPEMVFHTEAEIECDIDASAYGFDDANFDEHRTVTLFMENTQFYGSYRGLTLQIIDWADFSIGTAYNYDTFMYSTSGDLLEQRIRDLPANSLFLVYGADEYTSALLDYQEQYLYELGSPAPTGHQYRSSLCLLVLKRANGSFCTLARDYQDRYLGPASILVTRFNSQDPYCVFDSEGYSTNNDTGDAGAWLGSSQLD